MKEEARILYPGNQTFFRKGRKEKKKRKEKREKRKERKKVEKPGKGRN